MLNSVFFEVFLIWLFSLSFIFLLIWFSLLDNLLLSFSGSIIVSLLYYLLIKVTHQRFCIHLLSIGVHLEELLVIYLKIRLIPLINTIYHIINIGWHILQVTANIIAANLHTQILQLLHILHLDVLLHHSLGTNSLNLELRVVNLLLHLLVLLGMWINLLNDWITHVIDHVIIHHHGVPLMATLERWLNRAI